MDSEITMNYVVLLFSVTGEKTSYEQEFLLISAKKKKQNWGWLTEWFCYFLLGEVRIDYWLDKYDTLLQQNRGGKGRNQSCQDELQGVGKILVPCLSFL